MDHHYVICQCMASKLGCGGSCPTQKTSCWRSAPSLGLLIAPFQIVYFQQPNVHPMFHCAKNHFSPHPSRLSKTNKKPSPFPCIPCERLVSSSRYQS